MSCLAASPANADLGGGRAAFAATLRKEAQAAGLPFDVADAVVAIESGYDPTKIGGVGEVGLMQVRPTTAVMLGFTGSLTDLARPDVNIHYGVAYLAAAWRQAGGDLCRTLMKYRAGHGEEVMTPLSVAYCARARSHLASIGSDLGRGAVPLPAPSSAGPDRRAHPGGSPRRAGIRLRGAAFWAAHEARIRIISQRIERRWRRMAAR